MNENPGERFTPRVVIRLMVNLQLSQDAEALSHNHIVRTVCDPCCGLGGMLPISKERILEINPQAEVHLSGQKVNPETFAMCMSDLHMKSADGRDAENITFGSTLSNDRHADKRFDYLLANPLYGKDWNKTRRRWKPRRNGDMRSALALALPGYVTDSSFSYSTCSQK